jgi:hypothetical protein
LNDTRVPIRLLSFFKKNNNKKGENRGEKKERCVWTFGKDRKCIHGKRTTKQRKKSNKTIWRMPDDDNASYAKCQLHLNAHLPSVRNFFEHVITLAGCQGVLQRSETNATF